MKHRGIVAPFAAMLVIAILAGLPAAPVHAGGTYYSQGSLAPNLTTSWNTNRAGGGSAPTNFTSGDVFVIQNGHNMITSAAWSISGAGSRLWIENGATLTATSAVTLAAATTFQIDAGGTYVHNNTAAYGTSIFQGTEAFDAASTVVLNNSNTSGPSSVAFGNLTVNFTSDPGGSANCSGGLTTINGNLTIQSTSTREFRFVANSPSALTVTIAKDLIIQGGTLNISSGTSTPTVNLGGNFSQTGGTLTTSGVATIVFTDGSSSVTFVTSGGSFTNTNINWQITSGKTVALNTSFAAGSWVNASRTMTVNGTFQINQGAWTGSSGAWSYGIGATLIFNNTSGSYGPIDSTHVYWPASSGPTNVNVQGAGGITLGVARTVPGVFQTGAGVSGANQLSLSGTAQINTGGYFTGSPTYGANSTLVYNPGNSFNIGNEWTTGGAVGSGVPKNVTLQNDTAVVLPNGAGARTVPGDFTLTSGSLTLGGSTGDDLNIKGKWTNNGTFTHNGRGVTFNGTATQSIGGSSSTTFAYLQVSNAASVSLAQHATVNDLLTIDSGASLADGGFTLMVKGNIANAGAHSGTGKIVLSGGATSHDLTGNGSYGNLELNDALGASLGGSPTVNGTLTLTGGLFALGSNTLTMGQNAPAISGAFDNTRMIVADGSGSLCKIFTARTGNYLFPIGDGSGDNSTAEYSPGSLDFGTTGDTFPDTACVRVTDDMFANKPSFSATWITRYWTVTRGGSSAFTCATSFTYVDTDIAGNPGNEAGMYYHRWIGTTWQKYTAVTAGSNTFGASVSAFSPHTAFSPSPTAVTLESMEAVQAPAGGQIDVAWQTAVETDNQGFNLWRGTARDGPTVIKLNTDIIPSQAPGGTMGASYVYADTYQLTAGTTYFYWLEDVALDGTLTRHEPVSVTYTGPTAVRLAGFSATRASAAGVAAGGLGAGAGEHRGLGRMARETQRCRGSARRSVLRASQTTC